MSKLPPLFEASAPELAAAAKAPPKKPRNKRKPTIKARTDIRPAAEPARLAYRPAEFAALTGVSNVTIWRGIKAGRIPTVDHCGIKVIPGWFAVDAGFVKPAA